MRKIFLLPVLGGVLAAHLAGATIGFQVTSLGGNLYQYSYAPTGFTFNANEALDIQFDPTLYGVLSNGVVGPGFTLQLLQPNSPPGAFGDYFAEATIDNPPMAGPFTVDVTYLGTGTPGAQPFFLDQFDANNQFLGSAGSGTTATPSSVPEPASSSLAGLAFLSGVLAWGLQHLRRSRAIAGRRA